jgi:hypothetical protein
MKWLSVLLLAGLTAGCGGGSGTGDSDQHACCRCGASNRGPRRRPSLLLSGRVTIPQGTALRLDLATALATDTSKVEDPVRATLRQAVVIDGATVIPAGDRAAGVGHRTWSGLAASKAARRSRIDSPS